MKKRNELSLTEKVMQAMNNAVARVIEQHRREGRPLALWRDGKAVLVPVEELGKVREQPIPYRTKPARGKS